MIKRYSWQILCCTLLIIIFIFGYYHLQNKKAVQTMVERTVYSDLVYLHHFIHNNEQENWKDPDSVTNRLLILNTTNLQINKFLNESSYSFEEVEQIIYQLHFELMPYSIKLTGTEEEKLLFSQLKNYLEEAKITNDESLDINYNEHIKRLEHLIELLRQDETIGINQQKKDNISLYSNSIMEKSILRGHNYEKEENEQLLLLLKVKNS